MLLALRLRSRRRLSCIAIMLQREEGGAGGVGGGEWGGWWGRGGVNVHAQLAGDGGHLALLLAFDRSRRDSLAGFSSLNCCKASAHSCCMRRNSLR